MGNGVSNAQIAESQKDMRDYQQGGQSPLALHAEEPGHDNSRQKRKRECDCARSENAERILEKGCPLVGGSNQGRG